MGRKLAYAEEYGWYAKSGYVNKHIKIFFCVKAIVCKLNEIRQRNQAQN
jgi:hypothetical protein